MMRPIIALLLTSALGGLACAQPADVRHARSVKPVFDWPESDRSPVVENVVVREQVESFVRAVALELNFVSAKMDRFRFVRLWAGRTSLVATIAGSREFYWILDVLDWDGSVLRQVLLPAEPPFNLATDVTDVDGDGLCEIVTNDLALGYEGAATKTIGWRRVFKARADYTFEDVSRQNRAYFEKVIIPELDQLDAGLAERYEGADLVSAKAQVQFVRDKYRRMLYGEPEAGLNHAVAWSHSAQRELQQLAVEALYDIGTKEAREELTRLSGVSDELVAGRARRALYVMDAGKR